MDMVWPLWKRACGGQRGLRTWVVLKSARKGPRIWERAERVRRVRLSMVGVGVEVGGGFWVVLVV